MVGRHFISLTTVKAVLSSRQGSFLQTIQKPRDNDRERSAIHVKAEKSQIPMDYERSFMKGMSR